MFASKTNTIQPSFSPSLFGAKSNGFIQPKLNFGQSGDHYEVEADKAADQIVGRDKQQSSPFITPSPNLQRKTREEETNVQEKPVVNGITPFIQKKCSSCEEQEKLQKKEVVSEFTTTPIRKQSEEEQTQVQEKVVENGITPVVQKKCAACEEKERVQKKEAISETTPLQKKVSKSSLIQKKCSCDDKDNSVQKKEEGSGEGEQELLSNAMQQIQSNKNFEAKLKNRKGKGKSLDKKTQAEMESGFGADFSKVSIHEDNEAAAMSQEIGAQAFTNGSDIYFNKGKYDPNSEEGKHLLAHELTHTIQQGASDSKDVQKIELPGFIQDGLDAVSNTYDNVVDTVADGMYQVGDALGINDDILAAYEAAEDVYDAAMDLLVEAKNWLISSAGQAIRSLVEALGGTITVTPQGQIIITLPKICPIDAQDFDMDIDAQQQDMMIPIFGIPIGPGILYGSVGGKATIDPQMSAQVGPFCLEGAQLSVNPLTGSFSAQGSISATAAVSLGAEARLGLAGELSYAGVIVVGGVPVPVEIPLVGLEGGVAGLGRAIGVGELEIGGGINYSGGALTASVFQQLNIGLASDLFLGAYGQLDVGGENFCRLYWEPYAWHDQIAAFLNVSGSLTFGPNPSVTASVTASIGSFPFDQFDLMLSRGGFSDDCPIKERICQFMRAFNLFPSENGGSWENYGAGIELPGPLEVYERNPGRASGATCRGACGPDCNTCNHQDKYYYTDPTTGEVWEYTNYEECPTHKGCRDHDAGFDWAADVWGETEQNYGWFTMLAPAHMAANMECACTYPMGNCISWALGGEPHDEEKMHFAEVSRMVTEEERDLEQCDRGVLPPDFCDALYQRVIERFGNSRRDLNFDPDGEIDTFRFPEDSPILDSFRRSYNRLDSWNIFVTVNHPELRSEFNQKFKIEETRSQWIDEIKTATKEFKRQFRNIDEREPEALRMRFEQETLQKYEEKIQKLIVKIATWYKAKTGTEESIEDLIERVHAEGTTLWREAWRAAILAVNRILSILWPPAKGLLNSWIANERSKHPGVDLSGQINDIDYIGSLATGYKSPPKQHIRFNPTNFDVDASLVAEPLAKWSKNFAPRRGEPDFVDRGRIWSSKSGILKLIEFANRAHQELSAVDGYDQDETFEVVLNTSDSIPEQRRQEGSRRLYELREQLSAEEYQQLLEVLDGEGFMYRDPEDGRLLLRGDLSDGEYARLEEILADYTEIAMAPDIESETLNSAPDGSPNNRERVAVGEVVKLSSSVVGDWVASGGTPRVALGTDEVQWKAPNRAATVTITFTAGTQTVTKEFTIVEPDRITGTNKVELAYPAGQQGAGMELIFKYHPLDVSFGNIEAKEVSHAASNIRGYYVGKGTLWHDTGDTFFPVRPNNLDTATDTAAQSGFAPPWSAGGFDWDIPNHFRVDTEAGDGKQFTTVDQDFEMADATGKSSVEKAGLKVERTP